MDLEQQDPMALLGSFSMSGIISGVLFGIIGMWLFRWAKKNSDMKQFFISIALMFYPYFTRGPFLDWGVGIALCGLSYYYMKIYQPPLS